MAKVIVGNASAITVPRQDREGIRRFYCDVLGGRIVKEDSEKDILRLEEDFYVLFRYGDVPDESEFLRSPRSLWLQIKCDNVEEMTRRILDSGGTKIDLPSGLPEPVPYLYFQAPGGQCFQLLPINEDQAYYKGGGDGKNAAKEKEAEALKEKAMSELALRHQEKKSTRDVMKDNNAKTKKTCGYASVNGLNMYYEIEGTGDPLVYIPAAFGVAGLTSFPALVQSRAVITVDLQGHGRTADIPERPLSLQQHANDVVGLLKHLGITRADFLGESYGGAIATIIAVHHPELAGRIATYAATFGPPQVAVDAEMLRFSAPPTADSRSFQFQRENYKKVAPHPDYWATFLGKMSSIEWNGFSNEELASIKAPVLIAVGDHDFVRVEHAVEAFRAIPNAELAVIPDAGHYVLHSEPNRVIPVVQHFLEKSAKRIPIATAETGYHPGETR